MGSLSLVIELRPVNIRAVYTRKVVLTEGEKGVRLRARVSTRDPTDRYVVLASR